MTINNSKYAWAVVNEDGRLMREENDRRAIYRTREQARMAARVLRGRPVRRDEVEEGTPRPRRQLELNFGTNLSST